MQPFCYYIDIEKKTNIEGGQRMYKNKTNKCKYGRTRTDRDCKICTMYGKCELTEGRTEGYEKGLPLSGHRKRNLSSVCFKKGGV